MYGSGVIKLSMTSALPVTQMTSRLAVLSTCTSSFRINQLVAVLWRPPVGGVLLREQRSCDRSKHDFLYQPRRKVPPFSLINGILIGYSDVPDVYWLLGVSIT